MRVIITNSLYLRLLPPVPDEYQNHHQQPLKPSSLWMVKALLLFPMTELDKKNSHASVCHMFIDKTGESSGSPVGHFNLLKCLLALFCLLGWISFPSKISQGTGQHQKVENEAPTTRSYASHVNHLTLFLSLGLRQVVMAMDLFSWGRTCLWARRFPRYWISPRPITQFLGVGCASFLGDSRTTATICRPCS